MRGKKNIKSLLICNSNMFIPIVLTEVLSHPQEHYLVISDTENIHKFFKILDLPNIDYLKYGIKGRIDFIYEKKKLYERVSKYNIGKVVFFHAEFGEMANWLIKRLSKTTPIYYCKLYDSIPVPHCKRLWKVVKVKVRQWIYWGVDMDVLEHSYAFPSIPRSFYYKVGATSISMPVDASLVSSYVSSKLKDEKLHARYVLLTGTCVATGKVDAESYEKLINSIIEILGIENTVSKCHPRFCNLYGKERELRQIPTFIPGNVLIDNYDCYIGFESTLLVEAAVVGKTAISLIDLFPTNDVLRKNTRDFFDNRLQGRGNILFPKTIEELKEILKLDKDVNR